MYRFRVLTISRAVRDGDRIDWRFVAACTSVLPEAKAIDEAIVYAFGRHAAVDHDTLRQPVPGELVGLATMHPDASRVFGVLIQIEHKERHHG